VRRKRWDSEGRKEDTSEEEKTGVKNEKEEEDMKRMEEIRKRRDRG